MSEKKSIKKINGTKNNERAEQNVGTEKMRPIRIDQLLVQFGYAQSRERAKTLIKDGHVSVDGKPITKVSAQFIQDAAIEVAVKDIPWVSRAGLKLKKALETWPINVANSVCLDVGSSTGGFTEVLLHEGAKKVYALDVGYNQLAQRLRNDQRVIVMEGRNIRVAKSSWFTEQLDIITVDVSFISLKYVLPKVAELLRIGGKALVLIKPQFEVGKKLIRKGVVRDPLLHKKVIGILKTFAIKEGLTPVDMIESPIEGVSGNKEFLFYLKKMM
ncbi:MAG: TlyA family RNA methyltransferase [bacterium]